MDCSEGEACRGDLPTVEDVPTAPPSPGNGMESVPTTPYQGGVELVANFGPPLEPAVDFEVPAGLGSPVGFVAPAFPVDPPAFEAPPTSVVPQSPAPFVPSTGQTDVFIAGPPGAVNVLQNVPVSENISDIKERLSTRTGYHPDQREGVEWEFEHGGRRLTDATTVG